MSETVMFRFGRGDAVKHLFTKFKGVVICNQIHLNGCRRVGVQGTVLKDGNLTPADFFDEAELELVTAASGKLKESIESQGKTIPTGGPQRGERGGLMR